MKKGAYHWGYHWGNLIEGVTHFCCLKKKPKGRESKKQNTGCSAFLNNKAILQTGLGHRQQVVGLVAPLDTLLLQHTGGVLVHAAEVLVVAAAVPGREVGGLHEVFVIPPGVGGLASSNCKPCSSTSRKMRGEGQPYSQ